MCVALIEGNIYFEKQSEREFLDVSSVESYGINCILRFNNVTTAFLDDLLLKSTLPLITTNPS